MSLYFIALIPDPALKEKIRLIKEAIKEKYNTNHALKLPAHITLQVPFKMESTREGELFTFLNTFAQNQKGIIIELSGFGAFPPRVLFIKVKNHEPIKDMHKKLQSLLDIKITLNEREKVKEIHPHVTLATRDLTRKNFFNALEDLKQQEFTDSFFAKSLFLLKHNGKNWGIQKEILFNN